MRPLYCFPPVTSSNGASKAEHPGKTRASILYAPTNARIALTVSGASQLARVAIRCWLAWMVPRFHTQPSIVVVVGHIVVLAADSLNRCLQSFGAIASRSVGVRRWCFLRNICRLQVWRRGLLRVGLPVRDTTVPRVRFQTRARRDPGIPIAERAFTRTPRNGVTTPQYFIDSCDRGIW